MENEKEYAQMKADMQKIADSVVSLQETIQRSGSKTIESMRERGQEMMQDAKTQVMEKAGEAKKMAMEKGKRVDSYVQDNPWMSVGIAAAVGAVIGVLLMKKHKD